MVGNSGVLFKSTKQKIVCKSSTESELVALSDSLQDPIHIHEFMKELGEFRPIPTILQDNISTITIVQSGGGKSRNRHLKVRQYLVKDHLDRGDIAIKHAPATEMWADILTKPLQGALFKLMRSILLGEK